MQYIKSLDAIRAFAVILVIISHWVPYASVQKLSLGEVGVNIFFVLSGFLISRNLLAERKQNGESTKAKFKDLKNFVIRRALRIFPIYYLLLLA
ncbi:MAG: acyltransferase, partial [Leadbetterella sp.]|nr:acyltransferase [Leadbetterella sp.]